MERIKAKKVCEENYGLSRGHGGASAATASPSKSPKKKSKNSMLIKPNKSGFSGGEKDLYREYNQIMKSRAAEEVAAEELRKSFL